EPASGLLGKEYAKEAEAESDHHLHVRAARPSATPKPPRACGASAWRPSTGGPCAPARRWTRKTGGRSRACSAPRDYSVPALRAGYANGAADELAAPFARTAVS